MTSANNNIMPRLGMNFCCQHMNILKKINSACCSETVRNHRVKYIVFKSSSLKYNEISHGYSYLKEEFPVYDSTEDPSLRP